MLPLLSMGRRIHSDKLLGPCRVLWARAKANHLPDPQEHQVNLVLKKWEWFSHKTNLNPFLLCGKSALPLLKPREPLNHSFLTDKGTIWDGEGILQQSRTVYFQECHLLCAQAARGSNSSSNNKAMRLEHSAVPDRLSFPNTNRFPSPWPESASATNI